MVWYALLAKAGANMAANFRQIKAIERHNKQRILSVCPNVPETAGIYFFIRDDGDFKYAYIGQAKHLLTRLAQHLAGYQHIDLSIKKHGLFKEDNLFGWRVGYIECSEAELDYLEQHYIKLYASRGHQLLNKTSGGQGKGKQGIADNKPAKGYYDGLAQGYKNAQKFVANLFDKHLIFDRKSDKPNKNQEKALEKFKDFLNWDNSAE